MARDTDQKHSAPTAQAKDQRDAAPTAPARREITGPGASDFLAASGGLDTPETDPAKGARAAGEGGALTDERRLTPNLDEPSPTTEREIVSNDEKRRPGSK
jgi:hypothetical protein